MREKTLAEFGGENQRGSRLAVNPAMMNSFRELENLRPEGGRLRKVRGNSLHSTFGYKVANRPVTLIRYTKSSGVNDFIMTAWDNVFVYGSEGWRPLGWGERAFGLIPRSLLFDTDTLSRVNYPFDWMFWNEALYMTDGKNLPIKVILPVDADAAPDGAARGQIGTWGFKRFTTGGLLLADEQNAAGVLADADYSYRVSLYDSVRGLTGNAEASADIVFNPSGANKKVWIRFNKANWTTDGNYDCENEHADRVKIYRSPGNGGVPATTTYKLAATLKKGLIAHGYLTGQLTAGGTFTDSAGGVNFTELGVAVGFVLAIGAEEYQISAVAAGSLTIVNDDGQAYTGGAKINQTYWILPGFIDNDNDISGEETYHGELTTPEDHGAPPRCKYCVMFGDKGLRAFMAGNATHPNRVYYSDEQLPDYWPGVDEDGGNWFDVNPDDGDLITALFIHRGQLYIFKRNSVTVATVLGVPANWNVTSKVLPVGAEHKFVIADCGGMLVWANLQGVFAYDGGELKHISHEPDVSNQIERWEKIVPEEFPNFRAVYHKKRREYWLSVCLDDERGLYERELTGFGLDGAGYGHSPATFDDSGAASQNNGVMVFRLENSQWFFMPDVKASCFCVFDGQGDALELYRGQRGAAVFREDYTNGQTDQQSDSGFITSGSSTTIADSTKSWATDQWAGGMFYIRGGNVPNGSPTNDPYAIPIINNTANTLILAMAVPGVTIGDHYSIVAPTGDLNASSGTATGGDGVSMTDNDVSPELIVDAWTGGYLALRPTAGDAEYCGVADNSATKIWGDVFNSDGINAAAGWTSNPVAADPYQLVLREEASSGIRIKLRTQQLVFDSLQALKAYFEMVLQVLAHGRVTISWIIDGGERPGGTIQISPNADALTWGDGTLWSEDPAPTAVTNEPLWAAISDTLNEFNLDDDAEGRFIEIRLDHESSEDFQLSFIVMRYKTNTGQGFN